VSLTSPSCGGAESTCRLCARACSRPTTSNRARTCTHGQAVARASAALRQPVDRTNNWRNGSNIPWRTSSGAGLTGVRLRHRPSIHAVLQVSRYCFPRVRSKRGLAEDLIFELRLLDSLHAPLRHETDRLGAGDDLSDLSLLAPSVRRGRGFQSAMEHVPDIERTRSIAGVFWRGRPVPVRLPVADLPFETNDSRP